MSEVERDDRGGISKKGITVARLQGATKFVVWNKEKNRNTCRGRIGEGYFENEVAGLRIKQALVEICGVTAVRINWAKFGSKRLAFRFAKSTPRSP